MLECLNPSPARGPLREGVRTENAVSCSEPSPTEGDRKVEEVEATGVRGDEGGTNSGKGHADNDENRKRTGQWSEGMPVTHTCWVKAGHDLLHEREPFLRALLHKVRARQS